MVGQENNDEDDIDEKEWREHIAHVSKLNHYQDDHIRIKKKKLALMVVGSGLWGFVFGVLVP